MPAIAQLSIPDGDSTRNIAKNSENHEALKILGITALGSGALSVIWQRDRNN